MNFDCCMLFPGELIQATVLKWPNTYAHKRVSYNCICFIHCWTDRFEHFCVCFFACVCTQYHSISYCQHQKAMCHIGISVCITERSTVCVVWSYEEGGWRKLVSIVWWELCNLTNSTLIPCPCWLAADMLTSKKILAVYWIPVNIASHHNLNSDTLIFCRQHGRQWRFVDSAIIATYKRRISRDFRIANHKHIFRFRARQW